MRAAGWPGNGDDGNQSGVGDGSGCSACMLLRTAGLRGHVHALTYMHPNVHTQHVHTYTHPLCTNPHPTPRSLPGRWLYENQLRRVPRTIGRLKQLQRLWLDRNRLEELTPEIAGCDKLQVRLEPLCAIHSGREAGGLWPTLWCSLSPATSRRLRGAMLLIWRMRVTFVCVAVLGVA